MTDIVERLRETATTADYGPDRETAKAAIAEIDRLRAALREIADMIPYATPDYSHRVWATARAALGEKA